MTALPAVALTPLTRPEVLAWAALVVALSAVIVVRGRRPRAGRRAPRLGVVLVGAMAGELWWSGNGPWGLVLPLVALLAAGWLLAPGLGEARGWVALMAGAVLLGLGPAAVPGPWWVRAGSVVATVVLALALRSADSRWRSLVPPLLTVTAIGIYGTTPDTEQSAVLLTVVAGSAVIGWWAWARIGPVAAPAVAGLVVWTIAVGGRGSRPSVLGSFACLGVLLLEPVAAVFRRGEGPPKWLRNRWTALLVLGGLQAAIVAAGHAAGVSRSLERAGAETAAALALAGVALVLAAIAMPGHSRACRADRAPVDP